MKPDTDIASATSSVTYRGRIASSVNEMSDRAKWQLRTFAQTHTTIAADGGVKRLFPLLVVAGSIWAGIALDRAGWKYRKQLWQFQQLRGRNGLVAGYLLGRSKLDLKYSTLLVVVPVVSMTAEALLVSTQSHHSIQRRNGTDCR